MSNQDTIVGTIVKLDYGKFENTTFKECKLIYEGGRPPVMVNCAFIDSEFIFEGPALNTVGFMAAIARGGGEGAELIVHQMLGLTTWSPK